MKFEYKCLVFNNGNLFNRNAQGDLNELGSLGWELVSAVPIITGNEDSTDTNEIQFFLKRPLD
ncbi:DUF4177 domain-containing protein [Psychrobacillus sp. PGGUH221]|uniref:DUF4177 domain-containing protein n=1 Tax=Psychrobacillus sp. PGGUH221 TaxID=3020058 RepID=UPI0035C6B682